MTDLVCGLFACAGVNFHSSDGFSAMDFAHTAASWLIHALLKDHEVIHSGKPLHKSRLQAAQQRRHPPVRKGGGKGREARRPATEVPPVEGE